MPTPLLDDILQLSVSERIRLVEEIWDTIVEDPEQLPVTQPQKEEIDRRIEAHRQNSGAAISWQELRDRINPTNG